MFADDVVVLVLSGLGPNTTFTTNEETIHEAFYQLSIEHPTEFESFFFNKDGIYPFSSQIDQALFNLEQSGILRKHNPKLEDYEITDKIKLYTARIFQSYRSGDWSTMGDKFSELVS
jgi:hypothetical protein